MFQGLLLNHLLQRLYDRLSLWLERVPLDFDFLEFTCSQELVLLSAISNQIDIPHEVYNALNQIHQMVTDKMTKDTHIMVSQEKGRNGRPRILISEDSVCQLLDLGLPVTCIARLLGVSKFTVHRRMAYWGLSVKATYSNLTDEELDSVVETIHTSNPNAGYRMMMGLLRAQGIRVQWDRVRSSMHRVDTASIVSRMSQLGCVVRRTYSVPSPKSLMHIDTNHKLIR